MSLKLSPARLKSDDWSVRFIPPLSTKFIVGSLFSKIIWLILQALKVG